MKISFAEPKQPGKQWLAVTVSSDRVLRGRASEINDLCGDALGRAIQAIDFKGERSKTTVVLAPDGLDLKGVILVGIGNPDDLTSEHCAQIGGAILVQANAVNATDLTITIDDVDLGSVASADAAAHIAFGAQMRGYKFGKYRTAKADAAAALKKISMQVVGAAAARKVHGQLDKIVDAVSFTRDLVTEPANILFPDSYAQRIVAALEPLGVKVEVLDEKDMAKLGMHALLGVGIGSVKPPRMVVMQWNGAKGRAKKPLAFVGKGVTFDTGGISIKPAGGMEDMKWDMGGSATVVGLMHALAGRRAKVNAVGVVGLVENMPSGSAQRPGDVVKSMSGQTIEVLNTDAEGRLVLADALWYTQDRFSPRFMIDLATLTGAIMVSLGKEMAGLFCNRDELAEALLTAGNETGERCWRMPLDDAYDRQIDGDISDVKNISAGRWGGSITAAQFLQRFANGVPWAHLDIAGTAWADKDRPLGPKGATAYGVRMLNAFVAANYE